MGRLVFYRRLADPAQARALQIPMVSERTRLSGTVGQTIERVLAQEGIVLKAMGLGKMRLRGVRFKPFVRRAFVFPEALAVSAPAPDAFYPGRRSCRLTCTLPPGTYATILVKRLLLGA